MPFLVIIGPCKTIPIFLITNLFCRGIHLFNNNYKLLFMQSPCEHAYCLDCARSDSICYL